MSVVHVSCIHMDFETHHNLRTNTRAKVHLPGLVPAARSDGFPVLHLVVPVSQHHAVASDQQLPGAPQGDSLPIGVHHFSLQEKSQRSKSQRVWHRHGRSSLGVKYLRVAHDTADSIQLQVIRVLWESKECNRAVFSRSIKYLLWGEKMNAHVFHGSM